MSAPGQIEIDRSGTEPVVRITQPQESFTVQELRRYAEYLAQLADEAVRKPEPELDELTAVIDASQGRYMSYPWNIQQIARDVLAAGYKRETATTEVAT